MNIIEVSLKQIEVAKRAKRSKIDNIKKAEDLYYNRTQKTIKGKFNVPLPIMSGYVDTLKSKIDDKPALNFTHTRDSELKKAKKISKSWEIESSVSRGNWGAIDRMVKFLAIFSGRGIYKYFSESDPKYRSILEAVDYYNFLAEPRGGNNLENHLFCGESNCIYKTKSELLEGAKNGIYNKRDVAMLLMTESKSKEDPDDESQKNNRLSDLDLINNGYVGEDTYCLTEWYLTFGGKRIYLLFHEKSKIKIRQEEIKNIFSSNLYPYSTWATHPDPANFWSKAPVDDIRPVAEASKILFNQALDNIQKQNWGQRAYDINTFTNPEELEWRPDGLVAVNTPQGKKISDGIYEFKTASNETIVLNLMSYLDNYLGQKSGITPSAQGASDKDAKVGIYYGDMKQVQDRLGFYNKEYTDAWVRLGNLYRFGLIDNMTEPMAVDLLGENGIEWDELVRSDLKGDYGISVTSGTEAEEDEMTKQRKETALKEIGNDQSLAGLINQKWKLENYLRNAGYSEEEIRRACDKTEGSDDSVSEAAQENEDILKGKKVRPNRSATLAHIQRHLDYVGENSESLQEEKYQALLKHIDEEKPIVEQNMKRRAINMGASSDINNQGAIQKPEQSNPDPMARSQEISNSLIPQNV